MPPTGDSYTQIPSLSTAQRNLLQEALVSNKRSRQNGPVAAPSELVNTYFPPYTRPQAQSKAQALNFDSVNPAIFDVSQEHFPTSGYDTTFDESLLSTYNDTSGMFAFGSTATSPQQTEEHDKRKSPDEEDDEEEDESDHKRQEGDDKVAKKPGRKLITAEPTTVSVPSATTYPAPF
jgi:AP-1-like factor